MSAIQIDHSRADAERRMRLLEMAKGDLARALELEQWVTMGLIGKVAPEAPKHAPDQYAQAVDSIQRMSIDSRTPAEIMGEMPAHLVRAR